MRKKTAHTITIYLPNPYAAELSLISTQQGVSPHQWVRARIISALSRGMVKEDK
jgi:hypothetical protein